ncbi:MAG: DUF4292 domain-containing protein [Acidobacteria bacterium]|nr:DUF4292 domain-containing protein [Acidobacteriota bacterium]
MRVGLQFKILLALVLLFSSGCLSRRRVVPEDQRMLPALTMSRAELLDHLEKRSAQTSTLTATVALDIATGSTQSGVIEEYRQARGFILVDRPNNIRVQAQAPLALATVFDMVSDGKHYSAWIPLKNKFFVGDTAALPKPGNPVLNLRPQHILDALFVDIRPHVSNPQVKRLVEEVTSGRNSYYVFQFLDVSQSDLELVEKLWIDRSNMHVVRKQIFRRDGKVETDVEYLAYQLHGDVAFPQVITIRRPIEDYMLKITFHKAVFNEQLAADAFRLERPAGAELVQLEPASRRF